MKEHKTLESALEEIKNLRSELFFILRGIKTGSIKSAPIVDMSDENAESFYPITLAEHIEKVL
jgi:hypothetical protein